MGHTHDHHKTPDSGSSRQLVLAFVVNTTFAIIEIVGGIFTNSISVLADALHDLGDSLALGTAWYFEKISRRGRDTNHSYGYRRYSVVGALLNSVVLIAGSVIVVREAIERLSHPEPVHSTGMILLAILGIVMNGFAFSRLHHGHSRNVDVVRLHLLEDVLGWCAVLVGAIAIKLWNLYILDPLLSLLVSTWIIFQVIRRLRQSVRIILQNTPADITIDAVDTRIRNIPGVKTTHDTHLWTMDGDYHILTVHVILHQVMTMEELSAIKSSIRKEMDKLHIHHVTIEFEMPDEECAMLDC